MATKPKKKMPLGKRWVKGQSGNPLGKQTHLDWKLRQLTRSEFAEIANMIIKGNIVELKKIIKDENSSALHCMVASVAVKCIQKGDMHSLDILLNRMVGKVKEEVELTGDIAAPQVIVSLPSNGREVQVDGPGFQVKTGKKE